MLDKDKIRPIPQKMQARIKKLDKEKYVGIPGRTRYYTYFARMSGDLCVVYVAVKTRPTFMCKQVAVHGLHERHVCLVGDLDYFICSGYVTAWDSRSDEWQPCDDRYFRPGSHGIVNNEYVLATPEFRYCAIDKAGVHNYFATDLLEYLRVYLDHPIIEMLTKIGCSDLYNKKTIVSRLEKDKAFRKYIYQHAKEIDCSVPVPAILSAYKTGHSIRHENDLWNAKQNLKKQARDIHAGIDRNKLALYIVEHKTVASYYNDYYVACRNLGLDMTDESILFPKDLRRWHDVRVNQYASQKADLDKKKREELYRRFRSVADKYACMQDGADGYVIVIAQSPADLIREGDLMHHCVGRMGYDVKMANEKTLIFFARRESDPDTPFVTIEYGLETNRILQCYARDNTKPDDTTLAYITGTWLPAAQKTCQKILKGKAS